MDVKAETVVGRPWAADSCPWVGKLRTVLPFLRTVMLSETMRCSWCRLVNVRVPEVVNVRERG